MLKQRLLRQMVTNGAVKKVVPLDEVEHHISQSWQFVATLPNGKAILKLPS